MPYSKACATSQVAISKSTSINLQENNTKVSFSNKLTHHNTIFSFDNKYVDQNCNVYGGVRFIAVSPVSSDCTTKNFAVLSRNSAFVLYKRIPKCIIANEKQNIFCQSTHISEFQYPEKYPVYCRQNNPNRSC